MPDTTIHPANEALPHNLEIEQALLGALLVSADAYETLCGFLRPGHFYASIHADIYDAIGQFIESGKDPSPIALKPLFEGRDELRDAGGADYLVRLAQESVSVTNAKSYGEQIYDLHLRRAMWVLGQQMQEEANQFNLEGAAAQTIEEIERRLYELASTGEFESEFFPIGKSVDVALEAAEAAYKNGGRISGITTGLAELDDLLGGLHRSDLVVLAGRPGMGKSALALGMAVAAARAHARTDGRDGAAVAYFSLEMSHDQLSGRLLAREAKISSDKLRRGSVGQKDFLKLVEARNELERLPLFIDQTPALSVPRLRVRARRLQRQNKLGLIFIDYLQLMDPTHRGENRVQQVTEITRGLKAMAKELNVPVVALSQLSRNIESRDNKRPILSDLRESGSIEQDADVVMFIHRENYYIRQQEPSQGADESATSFQERLNSWQERQRDTAELAECIIGKQRHGPIGLVRLRYDESGPSFRSSLSARKSMREVA